MINARFPVVCYVVAQNCSTPKPPRSPRGRLRPLGRRLPLYYLIKLYLAVPLMGLDAQVSPVQGKSRLLEAGLRGGGKRSNPSIYRGSYVVISWLFLFHLTPSDNLDQDIQNHASH